MRLVASKECLTEMMRGAVIALGNFDGVHLGHQAVLQQTRSIAEKHRAPVAVLTFHPHPQDFFGSRDPASEIASLDQKVEKLASFGVDCVFAEKFDTRMAKTSAAEFVEQFLIGRFGARHIVTGENYRFGRGREGDVAVLSDLARRHGVEVTAVASAGRQGEVFSSTAIREALRMGQLEKVTSLLGTSWELRGKMETRGWSRGISFGTYVRPAPGTYDVRVTANSWTCSGTACVPYPAPWNLGDFVRLRLDRPELGETGELIRVGVLGRVPIASGVMAQGGSEHFRPRLRQECGHACKSLNY